MCDKERIMLVYKYQTLELHLMVTNMISPSKTRGSTAQQAALRLHLRLS